ncbi:hypothetical protein L6452_30466 [Arctium lappa]|uniref:Uncharacterized protein n=1 Tax=Arctium lappa TaxID=4217 RepID=A0ACB8ZHZ8_ARCLA|nr:hypothetical protein L6452_30466 [Arctium lappa]
MVDRHFKSFTITTTNPTNSNDQNTFRRLNSLGHMNIGVGRNFMGAPMVTMGALGVSVDATATLAQTLLLLPPLPQPWPVDVKEEDYNIPRPIPPLDFTRSTHQHYKKEDL